MGLEGREGGRGAQGGGGGREAASEHRFSAPRKDVVNHCLEFGRETVCVCVRVEESEG